MRSQDELDKERCALQETFQLLSDWRARSSETHARLARDCINISDGLLATYLDVTSKLCKVAPEAFDEIGMKALLRIGFRSSDYESAASFLERLVEEVDCKLTQRLKMDNIH